MHITLFITLPLVCTQPLTFMCANISQANLYLIEINQSYFMFNEGSVNIQAHTSYVLSIFYFW